MAKRSNGEGTLRQRSDGRWELTIMDGYQRNGKKNVKTFYGTTPEEAEKKALEYKTAKALGHVIEKSYRFSEWSDLWFDHHKNSIAPTTQESYRYTLRILKDAFGHRYINEIKAYDIELFLQKLQTEGKSHSMMAKCRGMLFQIFNKAEANDYVLKNPVRFAEKQRQTEPVTRKESFTREEMVLMMEHLPDTKIGWSIRLMLGTGMRTQELLALEPQHIESDGSIIHIRQAVNMVKGTVTVGRPKSRDSYRDVPVPEFLRQYAVKLHDTHKKYVWEVRKKDLPCNPSHFRSKFSEALSAIDGVRVLTPHCCRHTYVSIMQSIGVDLGTIQSIVGHATLDMTKHYLHVQDSVRQDAINRFSAAFDVNLNNPDDPAPKAAESPREVMEPIESLGNIIYFPNKKKA